MRLCSYVVVDDEGFAPNPFGGYCTLAACTPNHQGVNLREDDWLLGNSSARTGNKLLFAMRISQVLDFDEYYRDLRFAGKKADASTWQGRCGDNIYFCDNGRWTQALAFQHTNPKAFKKDIRYHRVFISNHFFYFGENAPEIPKEYSSLVRKTQGCRCSHDKDTVSEFIAWITKTYPAGLLGLPRDRNESDPDKPSNSGRRRRGGACQTLVDKPKGSIRCKSSC
jgi:hypothetical protein